MGLSAAQLETLVVKLTADTVNYEKGMGRVEKRAMATAKKLTAVGTKMTLMLTLPLMAMGGMATKSFAAFDDASHRSTAIMRGVTDEITGQMEAQAKALVGDGVQSATELMDAYYYLASAGMDAAASMKAMPTVQDFATAGDFDMSTATDLLTDAVTAFGLGTDQIGYMGDQVARATQNANDTMEGFSRMLTADAATAARNYGMELETLMGVLGGYASAGKKGAEAGNMLGRATRLLTKAHRKNGAEFKKYGIDVVDEATGEYRNFIDIIGDMENAFAGMSGPQVGQALEDLGFEALAQKAILPLIGMSAKMKEFEASQYSAAGAVEEMAEHQLKSFGNQLKITKNLLGNVAIEIGKELAPGVLDLNEQIKASITWWQGLTGQQKANIVQVGKWVAVAGPAVTIAGMLAAQVVNLSKGVTLLGTAVGGLWRAFVALAGFAAPLLPYVAIVAAIGAAVAGVAYLLVGPAGLAKAWGTVTTAVKDWYAKAMGFMHNWKHNLGVIYAWFVDNWRAVLTDALGLYVTYLKALPTIFWAVVKAIPRLLMVLGGAINMLFQKIFTIDMLKWVWEGVKGLGGLFTTGLKAVWSVVKAAVVGIITLLLEIPKALWEGLRIAGGLIKDMLVALATLDFEAMGTAINEAMGNAINVAVDGAERVAKAMGETMDKAWAGAQEYGNTLVDDFTKAQEDPLGAAGDVLADAGKEIAGAFKGFEAQTKGIDGLRFDGPAKDMEAMGKAAIEVTDPLTAAGTKLQGVREQVEKPFDLVFKATNLDGVLAGTADYYAMLDRTAELNSSKQPTAPRPLVAGKLRAPNISTNPTPRSDTVASTRMVAALERIAENTDPVDNPPVKVTQVDTL